MLNNLDTSHVGDIGFVVEDIIVKRAEFCNACDKLNENICVLCGCDMNSKILVNYSSCPMNKWGAVNG